MSEFKAKVSLVIMGHKFPMPPSFSGFWHLPFSAGSSHHIGINSQKDVEDFCRKIEKTTGLPLKDLGLIKGMNQVFCNGPLPNGVYIDLLVLEAPELTY